eukprot:maker-scaffold_36-snap-gene-0.0-mRNA-1 protein AED:0.00 eAED:0.00 QI:0/1/1/1/1/1/4/350/533
MLMLGNIRQRRQNQSLPSLHYNPKRLKPNVRKLLAVIVSVFVSLIFLTIFLQYNMESDDLTAASFPNQAAENENAKIYISPDPRFKTSKPKDAPSQVIPGVQIFSELSQCLESQLTSLQSLLNRRSKTQLSFKDFICSLNCPRFEPELEHSFHIYALSSYTFQYLYKSCLSTSPPMFSALILIQGNEPFFISCKNPLTGKIQGSRLWTLTQRLIINVLRTVTVPDILFGFDNLDWATPATEGKVPGWNMPLPGVVRYVGTQSQPSILFPTGQFIKSTVHCQLASDNYKSWTKVCRFRDTLRQKSFQEKKNVVFWRGSSTGVPLADGTTYFLPRQNVARNLNEEHIGNVVMDFGFTGGEPPVSGRGSKIYLDLFHKKSKPYVKPSNFVDFRYLLHMDGHTASWGLAQKFSSFQAAILWVESSFTYREHFYSLVEPWKHFVPISSGMSELKDMIKYLDDNPKIGEDIGKNAYDLFDDRLRPEATYCYLVRLFYSLAQSGETKPTKSNLKELGIEFEKFKYFPEFEANLEHFKANN